MERILSTSDCEDTLATPAESLMHTENSSEAAAAESSTDETPDPVETPVDPYADGSENTIDEQLGKWGIILVAGSAGRRVRGSRDVPSPSRPPPSVSPRPAGHSVGVIDEKLAPRSGGDVR